MCVSGLNLPLRTKQGSFRMLKCPGSSAVSKAGKANTECFHWSTHSLQLGVLCLSALKATHCLLGSCRKSKNKREKLENWCWTWSSLGFVWLHGLKHVYSWQCPHWKTWNSHCMARVWDQTIIPHKWAKLSYPWIILQIVLHFKSLWNTTSSKCLWLSL